MLKNYFKIALRNLTRNRTYALLNIFGLSIGLCCVLLIGMYVSHELSYDKFHSKYDSLYRVVESHTADGSTDSYATTYSALAPALDGEFASIQNITHVYPMSGLITGLQNNKYQEDGIVLVDSAFFEMFSFKLISGDPETALDQPLSMVITEEIATKFFGSQNPVGQSLRFKDSRNAFDFEITGVVESPPSNSHIQFNYLVSYESLSQIRPWEYNVKYYPPMYTYAEVSSPADAEQIEQQFPDFELKYYGEQYAEISTFSLQPLSDIHLYSNLNNELSANFDITYIYLFSGIGLFILIIACINFMNLATARSAKRAREVGMRKTLGAQRPQLIGQFLGEAVLMAMLSLALSLLMLEAILPYFNSISGKELSITYYTDWQALLIIFGVVFGVGILAGSYPALYLSSFRPIQTLKGEQIAEKTSVTSFRKGLVVFQFFISTALIFATVVITQQLNYIQNEKLGFDKEQVLIIPVRETANQFNITTLKEEILRVPGVKSASAVSGLPGIKSGIHGFTAVPEDNKQDSIVIQTLTGDFGFLETLGLNLKTGRDFSEEFGTDVNEAFIINETAAKRLGWSEDPLDQELTLSFYVTDLVRKKGKVIGVVEDFQYNSLHNSIDPVLIHIFERTFYHDYLAVKLSTNEIENITAGIQEKWKAFNADRPFEYFFLDATFDQMYRSEIRLSKIFNGFAILAIAIACLGLLGLASYSIQQRMKEIGIRKVLGASVTDIVALLGRDFTLLILVSQVLALPVAYLLMNRWLNDFAEKISIQLWLFIVSSLAVLLVAWLTISYQSIKAAVAKPVDTLRTKQ